MKVAYLTNCFPSPVEPYVIEEIAALRAKGAEVLATSARQVGLVPPDLKEWRNRTLYLQAPRLFVVLQSLIRCCFGYCELRPFLVRIFSGHESLPQRVKALLHTWLGVYYAILLQHQNVDHIHVHHGYFSAWVAMVAARLLGITYSMTLHGSDLLVKASYLDIKLDRCKVCFTISEYNREVIFRRYPKILHDRIVLRRLGVDVPPLSPAASNIPERDHRFVILAPGRLHPVKNHAFLIAACALLKARGIDFVCFIAGDGPERRIVERSIRAAALQREVKLLGQVAHQDLEAIYPLADLVVLTSRSEGIPLVLMEAMAQGCPVLAPNITGIPELVADAKTGFLYEPGSLPNFVSRVEFVHASLNALGPLRRAARNHVNAHFSRTINIQAFIDALFIRLKVPNENPILQ
jgi:glycosyltransferase involved in cell wall biosynthesis